MAETLLELARAIARREDDRVTARVRAEPALARARIATGATRAQARESGSPRAKAEQAKILALLSGA